jgi:uncharacterized integral membrane protein
LSDSPHSGGGTLRRVVAAVILVPLAIVIVAFAVANRQNVTVSLDPFNPDVPAASLTWPLFAVILVVLILGVIIGGIAAWLRQSKWRRTARRLEREVANLRIEVETLKRDSVPVHFPSAGPAAVPRAEPADRLKLRPPVS